MVGHIGTYASHTSLTRIMTDNKQQLRDLEVQLSSNKKAQQYSGLADVSQRLINNENSQNVSERFRQLGEITRTQVESKSTVMENVGESLRDFRAKLSSFASGARDDEKRVREVQEFAFRTMKQMEGLLNTEAGGEFLFGGTKTGDAPVNLQADSLSEFQDIFDGRRVTYSSPNADGTGTVQDATVAQLDEDGGGGNWLDFDANGTIKDNGGEGRLAALKEGTTIRITGAGNSDNNGTYTVTNKVDANEVQVREVTLPGGETNTNVTLTTPDGKTRNIQADFTAPGTIHRDSGDSISGLEAGTQIKVSGSASNDGPYTVKNVSGNDITIETSNIQNDNSSAGRVQTLNYYQGNQRSETVQLAENRSMTMDIDGADAAFEKAFRAMGMIAQGEYGSAGGLDQNQGRVNEAMKLMNEAIDDPAPGSQSIRDLEREMGFRHRLLDQTMESHKTSIDFNKGRQDEMEGINKTEVVSKLMHQSRSLEASYQAVSRVRQLSLSNFI